MGCEFAYYELIIRISFHVSIKCLQDFSLATEMKPKKKWEKTAKGQQLLIYVREHFRGIKRAS